jgi:hypothetical protein
MKRLFPVLAVAFALSAAVPARAQLSISLRGGAGIPTGSFASEGSGEAIQGAKAGFGYGLDAALGFTRFLALYAGFDHVAFDCRTGACGTDGEYTVSGVTAGVRLSPFRSGMVSPWLRGGVTFHELKGEYGEGASHPGLATDRAPGYEIGAGVNIPLFGVAVLAPQVRYIGQNLKYHIPGVDAPVPDGSQGVNYFKADLGFGLLFPFAGGR